MAITILEETDLDVVSKQRELVEEALGQDGVYIRMKHTLIDLLEAGEIKGTDRAKVIAETISSMSGQITSSAMGTALQWASQEKQLAFEKEKLQYELDLLQSQMEKMDNDRDGSLADRQLKQAQLRRVYGTPSTDSEGNVIGLGNDGKEYASIQNIAQDTNNKVKQGTALDAQTEQTFASTHKLVADTYINHGVFTWTTLNENGLAGVNKASTGYVTLSDLQKQVSKEQARGYVYNAWSNAASAGASMLGTLAAAEIESIPSTTWTEMINLWKIPTQNLGSEAAPVISI